MYRTHIALLVLAGLLAPGCTPEPVTFATAGVIERFDQTIGGIKGVARPGDFMMENDKIRIGILNAGVSMGAGIYGGSVVDADLQRNDPHYSQGHGNDLFNELFTTANMNIMAADTEGQVEVVADGSDGGAAIVRVTAPAAPFLSVLDLLWAILGAPDIQFVTDYILEPGAPFLRMITTATLGDAEPATEGNPLPGATADMPLLEYAIETGIVMGDFYLSGGSVDVFSPGIGFDEEAAVQAAWAAGQNLFIDPITVDYLASAGDGTSYGLAPLEGVFQVPMFASDQTATIGGGVDGDGSRSRFPDGTAWSYERIFAVGEGDVGSVLDAILQARGTPVGQVEGYVREDVTGDPLSNVHVFVYKGVGADRDEFPYSDWRTDIGRDQVPDGSFAGSLPVGVYTLVAHSAGRGSSEAAELEVVEGSSTSVSLELSMSGKVTVHVVDDVNRPVPAKVSFFPTGDTRGLDPALGDPYIAGSPANVSFTGSGALEVELPPGTYQAVASHGFEYEIDTSPVFEVSGRSTVEIQLQVIHSVDSTGFVAADLHVHSEESFDSGMSLIRRIDSMAAEGVEFFPSTDHDYITDYDPTIDATGMENWVRSVPGVEVTTLELGHFLAWPLAHDTMLESGGALDWTDLTPGEIFDSVRSMGVPGDSEPLVMVAHARDGILGYYDQYGVSNYEADGDEPLVEPPLLSTGNDMLDASNLEMEFEAFEVFNAKRFELIRSPTQAELDDYAAGGSTTAYDINARTIQEQEDLEAGVYTLGYGPEGQVDDWFNLINLGYRVTAIGNSDTHDRTRTESGCPRNFVVSDTDSPAIIDPNAIAEAVREHRVVTSYGPYLQFEADGSSVGSEIVANGPVSLHISVQTPSWFGVDRVELYENGNLVQEWNIEEKPESIVDFDEEFTVEPSQDSWYSVITMSHGDMMPVCTPVERTYVQLQDVVAEALGNLKSLSFLSFDTIPQPRSFPVYPYAITNPIWVDVGGDGWTPPGLPVWLSTPEKPKK